MVLETHMYFLAVTFFLFFRSSMKVCKWSSKTSETKSTQKSSGSDLEDGFINTGITRENKDEAGYTSLQREPVG